MYGVTDAKHVAIDADIDKLQHFARMQPVLTSTHCALQNLKGHFVQGGILDNSIGQGIQWNLTVHHIWKLFQNGIATI